MGKILGAQAPNSPATTIINVPIMYRGNLPVIHRKVFPGHNLDRALGG
jgi:hypothetical protein